ncbi:MAG: hypothetical protein M3R45_14985 [Pseudomonadota bacterium]|nr:hypothetical protein [Pseudomonadota bacterium]
MGKHDFTKLSEKYPALIASMKPVFGSHEFILALAQQNQALYVDALHAYRDSEPFMIVHGQLSANLNKFQKLVEPIEPDLPSRDIFGKPNSCKQWRKLAQPQEK